MPKILIVSDSPALKSGLGRVTREIAGRLALDGVEVGVAGWFDIHADIAEEFPYPVYPAVKERMAESIGPLLTTIQPDLVLAIGDPWDFEWLATQRGEGATWRLAGYLNVEGKPFPLACERILDGFDVVVTTSLFGARTIGRPGIDFVHHGVDPRVFRPMADRRGVFVGHELDKTFLVLLNGQNTPRKNFPTALRGFAKFAQGKNDVLLYANTDPAPVDIPGPDLRQTIVHLGETDQIWFNPENRGPLNSVSDEQLNRFYNMASVLLVTSWTEGFGLPVLEAQAVGVVPVAPDDYSMPELLGDRGFLYPVAARLENSVGMTAAVVSDNDVAAALEFAYQEWKTDPKRWAKRRTDCLVFARSKTWDQTYQGIRKALESAPPVRVAGGRRINPQLRMQGRAAARRNRDAFGVLKLGGLGDLLQTTVVVAAAAKKLGRRAVIFTNQSAPVFEGMPEVAEVIKVASQSQQTALESLADEFPVFYDIRYISWVYGEEKPNAFAEQHQWFYDQWTESNSRLHSLGLHSTELMLKSLGLEAASIAPIYPHRVAPVEPAESFAAETFGKPNSPILAVSSGSGVMGGLKRWPSWAVFSEQAQELGFQLVQIGGKDDPEIPGAKDLRGLTIAETAWVIDHCRAVVATEGGMVHLAAATETPTVVIFGPTPAETFLYPRHIGVGTARRCTPCWGAEPLWSNEKCAIGAPACVNFPSPSEVLKAVKELVNGH